DRLVTFTRAWRRDLDNDLGSAVYILPRQNGGRPLVREVLQIRLDDIEVREHDIERWQEDFADRMCFQLRGDHQVEASENFLVRDAWRRRHVVLSVDD